MARQISSTLSVTKERPTRGAALSFCSLTSHWEEKFKKPLFLSDFFKEPCFLSQRFTCNIQKTISYDNNKTV